MHKIIKDPWLIYEGCVLLWNISLPFLNNQFKILVYNGFKTTVEILEKTFSNDYKL